MDGEPEGGEHLGNIQGTFREHSMDGEPEGDEHLGNIQGTFRERSGNIQWTESLKEVNI
jgi:hypothetical protein